MSAGCSGGGTCSAAPVHVEIYGVTGCSVLHAALCSMYYVLRTRGFCLRIRWLLAAGCAGSKGEHGRARFFPKNARVSAVHRGHTGAFMGAGSRKEQSASRCRSMHGASLGLG